MLDIIAVGCGGFIGAVLRYFISLAAVRETTLFPIKTFIINIIGCIVIGGIAVWCAKEIEVNPRFILFLKAGVCGGFTTFSTFALETSGLIKDGHMAVAALYVTLSVMVGVAVIFAQELVFNR